MNKDPLNTLNNDIENMILGDEYYIKLFRNTLLT